MSASAPKPNYMTYGPYLRVLDLQERGLYRLYSRNLDLGVWDGKEGFIGLRSKFGEQFLFKEIHWDLSKDFGTVRPVELIDTAPEDIEIVEGFVLCRICREPDTHHVSGNIDHPMQSVHHQNAALFNWIEERLQKDSWRTWG